jgi:hypothetical protein
MSWNSWGGSWLGSWGASWGDNVLVDEDPHNYYGKGRANRPSQRRSEDSDDVLIRQVNEKWEAIEQASKADAVIPASDEIRLQVNQDHIELVLDMVFDPVRIALPNLPAKYIPTIDPPAESGPISIKSKQDEEALILLLLEA